MAIRLYIDQPLNAKQSVVLTDNQVHYLYHVMRGVSGDMIHLFNGRDGEWQAALTELKKNKGVAVCEKQIRKQSADMVLDAWLCFAPIKKDNMDFVVEKATELGVSVLQPVTTRRTINHRVNVDKMQAQATEAAEQSERLTVPQVREPVPLEKLLTTWDDRRILYYLNERGQGYPLTAAHRSVAFLVGPEGGFDASELDLLSKFQAVSLNLGRRILRAETASITILANWNHCLSWN